MLHFPLPPIPTSEQLNKISLMKKLLTIWSLVMISFITKGQDFYKLDMEEKLSYLDSTFFKMAHSPQVNGPLKTYSREMMSYFSRTRGWNNIPQPTQNQLIQSIKSIHRKFLFIAREGQIGINSNCLNLCKKKHQQTRPGDFLNGIYCLISCR